MTERAQGSPEPQRHSFVFPTAGQVTPITHAKPLHRGDVTQLGDVTRLLSCTARNLTREHRERTRNRISA
ncbi:MAG: hypothetical protein OCU22_04765 [Canidatus Methanoxibalbensis ujae]|nr:hypothetical protein [Candidatus Methanoxibalbensis ujae]